MTATQASTNRPTRWSRMAAMGLLLASVGPLLMLFAWVLWGLDNEDVPFFLISAAIGLIGGFVVLRFPGVWAKVVGLVASILVGGALFWTAFGLAAPNSFFDFVPGLLVLPGAIFGIVGSIAGIVATRRGKADSAPAEGETKAVRVALSAVVALAAVSGVLTFLGKETVDEGDADTVIALSDFEFDEESYSLDGGTTVLVRNDDPFQHTFTIEELDIDETMSPGSEKLVEIPSEAGDYILFCRPHTSDSDDPSEDDMAAEFTVQ